MRRNSGGVAQSAPAAAAVFLHKHPRAHTAHEALARQAGIARFRKMAPSGLSAPLMALVNAWRLAHDEDWDSLFAEGPCFEGIYLRVLDRKRRPRVRLDMGSTSLRMENFPLWERVVRQFEMKSWSAIVVTDEEAATATRRHARRGTELIEWTPKAGWGDPFRQVVADRGGRVVAIMQGLTDASPARIEDRLLYKGLDRVAAVSRVGITEGWGPVTVYGDWPDAVQRRFTGALTFAGHGTADEMLRGGSVLVHTCRQDGFGLAVLDAMIAGVPPVVSRAGSAKLVAAVEPRLVVGQTPDEEEAVETVRWVRSLDDDAYDRLAGDLRSEALRYLREPDAAVERLRSRLGYEGTCT